MTLDRLDRRVGRDLHISRAVQGGASVAAGDGGDGREHVVLDERTSDGDAQLQADAALDGRDDAVHSLKESFSAKSRRSSLLGGVGNLVGVLLGAGDKTGNGSDVVATGVLLRATEKLLQISRLGGRVNAASTQSLLKLDVNKLVRLLIIDHDVHVRAGQRLGHVEDGGRRHAVELANLRRALQHLNRVLVCEHGKGIVYANVRTMRERIHRMHRIQDSKT